MVVTLDNNTRNKRAIKREFEQARKSYLKELQDLRNKYESTLTSLALRYSSL